MRLPSPDKDRPLFFDGGMGTMLQSSGITGWSIPEELNITHPDLVCRIHTQYLDAGCDIITANTFGANRVKLAPYGYDTAQVIAAAVKIARKAVSAFKKKYVALDIGSTGMLMEPMGQLTFDEAYTVYAEAAAAGERAGADLVIIETMSDLYEIKAAVLAVKENTKLPIIVSAAFQDNNHMLTGADVLTAVTAAEAFGADAAGFNCGGDLEHARQLVREFVSCASVPVIVQPNAGLPQIEHGKTVFRVEPAEFASVMAEAAHSGALILGGCCGTTPAHIAAMVRSCRSIRPKVQADTEAHREGNTLKGAVRITSYCRTVTIGGEAGIPGSGPKIIGERINPTGKKRFKQAIQDGDIEYILNEGSAQSDAGADILDVNVGLPGIDEKNMMTEAVRALQRTLPLPLQIDSGDPAVLEQALRYYNGKPLVNSVNGKAAVMDAVFPLIKKYGAAVVGLTLDENGIPETAEGRLVIAERIINRAADFGIAPEDILIDTLTLTISSRQEEAQTTLKAVSLVKQKLGRPVLLGVSNISFGLPRRELINSGFLTLALQSGLDACILNPLSLPMMDAYRSWKAISGWDNHCLGYIEAYAGAVPASAAPPAAWFGGSSAERSPSAVTASAETRNGSTKAAADRSLKDLITGGFRDQSAAAAEELLKTMTPLDIINTQIIPALDEVGRDFEIGKKFLPQLLLSADTVAKAFEVIKRRIAETGIAETNKGTIILATVYGDIHDIGKNIVHSMLENYGYRIIDLGKNVECSAIVECARKEKPGLIGLSALMTTTVPSMAEAIRALKEAEIPAKIMAGGAVLTEDYAKKIGADYYAADAMASVTIAKSVFGETSILNESNP